MTRQEAIEWFKLMQEKFDNTKYADALNMAIGSLEKEPIIHCKDCKYWHEWENGAGSCHKSDIMWVGSDYDDYCSFAEKRGSDGE